MNENEIIEEVVNKQFYVLKFKITQFGDDKIMEKIENRMWIPKYLPYKYKKTVR